MIRPVILVPDARLSTPCAPVTRFDLALRALALDLEETMRDGPGSVGVAACQIGEMTARVRGRHLQSSQVRGAKPGFFRFGQSANHPS